MFINILHNKIILETNMSCLAIELYSGSTNLQKIVDKIEQAPEELQKLFSELPELNTFLSKYHPETPEYKILIKQLVKWDKTKKISALVRNIISTMNIAYSCKSNVPWAFSRPERQHLVEDSYKLHTILNAIQIELPELNTFLSKYHPETPEYKQFLEVLVYWLSKRFPACVPDEVLDENCLY